MWYRVVCTCGAGWGFSNYRSGPAKRTPEGAWESWKHVNRLHESQVGEAANASSARMIEGTTRRAVEDADVSRVRGRIGKGEWWIA